MTLFLDRAGRFSLLKTATFALVLLPAAALLVAYGTGGLGPLPVKEAIHESGEWAIRLLVATLALTPAQRILSWPRLALVRRMLGVASFAYALVHVALYVAEQKFQLATVASEIALRIHLTIGFVALAGMSLLAATSTDAMIRRLGRRWKPLHRLVYGIAALALLHFFMQSKIDASEAALMAGLALLLMVHRALIAARWPLTPAWLAAAAFAGAGLTALTEVLWYGMATGIDPWRVALANLDVLAGLRPALLVLLAGLTVALAAWLRSQGSALVKRAPPRLRSAT